MHFSPAITEQEYQEALRAEVAAALGEERAREDESQIAAAAHALWLVAQIDVSATAEPPFFLGVSRDE